MVKKEAENKYFYGLGRRKTAIAQVRIYPGGKGKLTINSRSAEPIDILNEPFKATGLEGQFDITAVVKGGGFMSQKEAMQLGIARALIEYNEELKPALRKLGYVTRDPREKERKKPGLKRARKAPQWAKR